MDELYQYSSVSYGTNIALNVHGPSQSHDRWIETLVGVADGGRCCHAHLGANLLCQLEGEIFVVQ